VRLAECAAQFDLAPRDTGERLERGDLVGVPVAGAAVGDAEGPEGEVVRRPEGHAHPGGHLGAVDVRHRTRPAGRGGVGDDDGPVGGEDVP